MSYRVILNQRAEGQLEVAYRWWHEHRSPEQAARCYNGFLDALGDLRENPERFAIARENPKFPYSVRELHYGLAGRATHRALFTVRQDIVFVYSIRHVAQKDVSPDELSALEDSQHFGFSACAGDSRAGRTMILNPPFLYAAFALSPRLP